MSAPAQPSVQPSAVQTQAQPEEASALNKVMWFGILQLVGIASGWVLGFYVFGVIFTTPAALNLGPTPTPAEVSAALGPLFQTLSYVMPVTIVVELAALAVLTLGLRDLRRVDSGSFSVPSTLMIVLMAGVVIVGLGVIPLFNSLPNIIAQAPATPGGAPSAAFLSAIGSFLFDMLFMAVGGLLSLAGLIGGQILGLWRVGSRYDQTVVKLGAIEARRRLPR